MKVYEILPTMARYLFVFLSITSLVLVVLASHIPEKKECLRSINDCYYQEIDVCSGIPVPFCTYKDISVSCSDKRATNVKQICLEWKETNGD